MGIAEVNFRYSSQQASKMIATNHSAQPCGRECFNQSTRATGIFDKETNHIPCE